ncbi:BrnA antitoxin family protein (plasmid) [Agrobacterium rosae]|uniref:BrnA antitoxin of type II toxin-antitoxin system n=1 Tax=Agrobacterium rosae TaxID=1972867 RepID=A0AAW9FNK5_9HYPH|nr:MULTISPECIES: hypothetical protein [Agrobacterium]MDX8321689.1 hypothetical protein [Agrobacterium sp. rho-8.1]MDX8305152.1 hypothetical protein [Agrobacterium rosae]MDX8311435.1 hypothetical protein [Agrobacterium sp. rho-13.3]MDX8316332.1 hypothetical protein [Agrobacterium rosae]MDX8332361.1 hypothetical protein [Agrobacterium rosae]
MTASNMKRASLSEIAQMRTRGELYHNPKAPEGEKLDEAFWSNAKVEGPVKPRSVHLKLDPEVFEHFLTETGGKGHLTRMQAVLKAYANAQRKSHTT